MLIECDHCGTSFYKGNPTLHLFEIFSSHLFRSAPSSESGVSEFCAAQIKAGSSSGSASYEYIKTHFPELKNVNKVFSFERQTFESFGSFTALVIT